MDVSELGNNIKQSIEQPKEQQLDKPQEVIKKVSFNENIIDNKPEVIQQPIQQPIQQHIQPIIKDEIKDEIKEISKQPIQTTSFFSMNIQTIIFAFIMLLFCIIFHYVIAIKKTPLIDHQDIENKIM